MFPNKSLVLVRAYSCGCIHLNRRCESVDKWNEYWAMKSCNHIQHNSPSWKTRSSSLLLHTRSDESTCYVLERKNQVKIWRSDAERLHPDRIQQMNTGNGGKVGIWGGISGQGIMEAKVFDGNMDGQSYWSVLNGESKRSMAKLSDRARIVYQQDLAPWHASSLVNDSIKTMKLKVFDWPAKSPAMNPIEMLWSILYKKLIRKSK